MNADQILLSFANAQTEKELPGVYFLCGFDARRITAVSQQHRAISLVEALIRKGRLRPATKVGVLGGGIAGCTFAYWAACHGAHVTIYEQSQQLLDVWDRASHRWLHPGLFNWPNHGWDQPDTNLPCLNWSFNTAQEVGRSLRQKMDRLAEDLRDPYLRIQAGRAYHLKASPGRRPAVDCPNGLAEDHDLVVVAVGNGDYPGGGSGPAYWDGNADKAFFDQLERNPAARVSVVGNGDGGIMDVLRMKTPVTDERALLDFLAQWRRDDPSSLERVEDVVRSHESSPGMQATPWTSVVQAMGSTGAGIFKRELARRASWQKHLTVDWYYKRQKLNPGASALLRTLLVGFMEADKALVAFREQEFSRSKQGNAAGKVVERVIRKRPIQHLDQAAAHPGGAASRPGIVGLAGSLSGFQEGDFFAGWYLFSKESTDRGQQAEPVLGGQRMQPAALLKAFEEEMAKSCARVAVPILPFSRNREAGEGLVDSNLLLLSVHTMLRVVRHLDSRESKSEPLVRSQTIQSAPQPFFEAARPGDEAESQIVLMGDGGRGKTTLTGFLASSLLMQPRALADLKERDPDVHAQVVECRRHWDGFLPVVIRLRDLGKRNLDVLESAEELVLSALFRSSSGYETDLRDVPIIRPRHRVFESFRESLGVAIQGRRIVLIIDGMDEVNVASAKLVAALFGRTSRGLSAFKPSQVIITARTSSVLNVDRGWYGLLRWPLLEIEPLSADWPSKKESQQYAFALRYFRCLSVEEPKPMTKAMIDHVRAITGDLMTAVADRDVSDLAKEPILLASFARLYARHEKIPATRVEVLHGIMDLLMDEWDATKKIPFTVKILATEQKLSPEIPKRVLGRIASGCLLEPPDPSAAFRFMQRGSGEALLELLEGELRVVGTVEPQGDALRMADAMAERFGILRRTDTSKREETSGAVTPPAKSRPWMSPSPAPDPTFLEFSASSAEFVGDLRLG